MRKITLHAVSLGLLWLPLGGATVAAPGAAANIREPADPANTSYTVGLFLGDQLAHNGLASRLTLEELVRGLKEGLAGHLQSPAEREATLRLMRNALKSLADSNQAAAHDFLAHNATQPGIQSLPSGLQYRVLAEGDPNGKPPSPSDQVTVRYRASLPDGHEFDRSDAHDRPAAFRANSVLKAWQEAFRTMKPGAHWQLFVPPELGYGVNTPYGVPPGSLLIYDLELLKVEPAPMVDSALLHRVPEKP